MNVTAEASARWAGASVRAREAEVLQGGVRKSKQKVLAGWISHGQCYAPNERTRGWFPLTIAGLLGCQLSSFPICQLVGKLESWRVDAGADQGEGGRVGG